VQDGMTWKLIHAESESGVIHGFNMQFSVMNVSPTGSTGISIIDLYIVRANALPNWSSIESVPSEDVLSSKNVVASFYESNNYHVVVGANNYQWFSKRKCRLPINTGLYVGMYKHTQGEANIEVQMHGHGWLYKKVA
jgi:hypothetical protein